MKIKQIKIKFEIVPEDGGTIKHSWIISGFLHRKLRLEVNNELKITTATKIRDWFMRYLQGVVE